MTFATNGTSPFIVQVTSVALPFRCSMNSTTLRASIGLVMFRFNRTFDGAGASVISMLPAPTLLSPSQA